MESGWKWDRLDPFERRVAELLLEGKSNAAICAEVFHSRARVQDCIKKDPDQDGNGQHQGRYRSAG